MYVFSLKIAEEIAPFPVPTADFRSSEKCKILGFIQCLFFLGLWS